MMVYGRTGTAGRQGLSKTQYRREGIAGRAENGFDPALTPPPVNRLGPLYVGPTAHDS